MPYPYQVSYDEFNRLYSGFTKSEHHLPTPEEKKYLRMDITMHSRKQYGAEAPEV